jgi:hypothetical protein
MLTIFCGSIEFAEIQVGGSLRILKFSKVEFTHKDGLQIIVNMELIPRKVYRRPIEITGSMRYDKAQILIGNISPRFL